jgi:transcriptional regulator with XRE-family HTH domain
MDIRGVVGLNLQRLRRERGISQEELSFLSGSTRAYLSGLEAGRRNATLLTLAKLAQALRVDVSEFFLKPAKSGRPARRPVSKSLASIKGRTTPRENK